MLVTMSNKELHRLPVIQAVVEKRLRRHDAASQLDLSERQVQCLMNRFREFSVRQQIQRLLVRYLAELARQATKLEKEIQDLHRGNADSRRLSQTPGIMVASLKALAAPKLWAIITRINHARGIMMRTNVAGKKRSINVYLNAGLLEEAKELDLNISSISNQALETAVRECKRERWIEENRVGIEALNSFVEEVGIFSDDENFGVI